MGANRTGRIRRGEVQRASERLLARGLSGRRAGRRSRPPPPSASVRSLESSGGRLVSAVRCESCIPREAERAQRELREREREGGESVYALQVVPCSSAVGLVGWIGMPCDFSAESFRQPTTRYPSKEPVCGKRLIRVIRAPIGRGRRPHRRLQLCSVLIASLSLFGSTHSCSCDGTQFLP